MHKKYFIYKLTSPSGKVYIGQTRNLSKRLLDYFYIKKVSIQKLISEEILKFGINSFNIEIIRLNLSLFHANKEEKDLIKKYKDLGISLNMTDGGELDVFESYITYKVDSDGNIIDEYESSASAAKLNGINQTGIGIANKIKTFFAKGNYYIYKHHYDNGLFELRKRRADDKKIKIIQLDLSGNIVNKFDSIKDASDATSVCRSSIQDCIKKKLNQTGSFIWIRESEYKKEAKYEYKPKYINYKLKEVIKIDKNTGEITEYLSAKDAAIDSNTTKCIVQYQCSKMSYGTKKTGCYFRYKIY